MRISVGIDIAKEVHWVTAIDPDGVVRIDRKLLNTPADIAALIDELAALGGEARVGLDVVGGIAGLATAASVEALTDTVDAQLKAHDEKLDGLETTVAGHTSTLAEGTAQLMDGELITAEFVGDGDLREQVLKAFRQIEHIANTNNIRLPS